MADLFDKLVVGAQAPRRRAVLFTCIGLGLAVLYAAFEFGRYEAGFRVVDSMRGALSASRRIRDLESDNDRQRQQLEAADVARRVDHEAYKQVERNLGDMQSQIARLTQDLSFYRGLVQPDSLIHVKVQTMQIVPQAVAGQFALKFVLMQTGKQEKSVAGTTAIAIEGSMRGKPVTLSFAQVSVARRSILAYAFRYFQSYDELVALPAGFEPARVGVEIHAGRDSFHAFRQAFVWKAQGMSLETETAGAGAAGVGATGAGAAGVGAPGAGSAAQGAPGED